MKKYTSYLCYLLFATVLLSACSNVVTERLQHRELVNIPRSFEVKYKIVYEKNQPYLFLQAPVHNYKLSLRVYTNYDKNPELIWTSEPDFRDSMTQVIHKVKIDVTIPQFALDIRVVNSNQQILFHDIAYLQGLSSISEILYLTDENGTPILDNYLKAEQSFKLTHNSDSILKFYIKYYEESFNPAPPPQSQNSGFFNAANKTYNQLFVVNRGRELKLSEEGLYFIQTDTASNKGIYINYFGPDYPSMTRLGDLVLATRYITTDTEYNKMRNAANIKVAFDEYWLARNKKETEAKRLISLYYNRMMEANRLFPTTKEGWKTDMGMIFTVFGRPDIIRRYSDKVVWYYSQTPGRYPVEFVFAQFTGQYILERSGNLKEPWSAEILKWRIGQAE